MLEAVADAGPLIHLDEVGLAPALHVFRRVTVPMPIAQELRLLPRGPGVRLLRQQHVHVTRPSKDEMAIADAYPWTMGGTDCQALAMAQSRDVPLLTDDLDLRDAAKALAVTPIGTIGLIVRAASTGLLELEEARRGLDLLLAESSMFITRGLVERAKDALDRRQLPPRV